MTTTDAKEFNRLADELDAYAQKYSGDWAKACLTVTWCDMKAIVTALRTTAAASSAGAVKVKPLEWRRIGDCWKADRYSIRMDHGVPVYYVVRGWDSGTNPYDTLDAAKAAAQADYESRILAALIPEPAKAGDAEASAGAVKELDRAALFEAGKALCEHTPLFIDGFKSTTSYTEEALEKWRHRAIAAAKCVVRAYLDAAKAAAQADYEQRILAAFTEHVVGWRTMDSAPKDGTRIDLWMVNQNGEGWRQPDAYWVEDYDVDPYNMTHGKRSGWFAPNHDYDGQDGWCDTPEYVSNVTKKICYVKPTHWMPLPARPVSEGK